MDIIFTNRLNLPIIDEPKPASAFIPEWYKNLNSYITKEKKPTDDGTAAATAKKCMPLFDVITAGYIITSVCDIYIEPREGAPFFKWSGFDAISFHPVSQTTGHPATHKEFASPKFINPWGIKTPKGWSSLIIQPSHRDLPFTIMPGLVDTDTYTPPINFPFTLNDINFKGMIPAGTPIAQVIPIKRESWKMKIGKEEELKEINTKLSQLDTIFFDRYKRFWWNKKEYK